MIPPVEPGDDSSALSERDGLASRDEAQLLRDLGALLDELRAAPGPLPLDYDDIWRRIDRDIG